MTPATTATDRLRPLEHLMDRAEGAGIALAIRDQVVEEWIRTGVVRDGECSRSIAIVDHTRAGEAAYLQRGTRPLSGIGQVVFGCLACSMPKTSLALPAITLKLRYRVCSPGRRRGCRRRRSGNRRVRLRVQSRSTEEHRDGRLARGGLAGRSLISSIQFRSRLSLVRVDAIGVGHNFALHLRDCRFPVDRSMSGCRAKQSTAGRRRSCPALCKFESRVLPGSRRCVRTRPGWRADGRDEHRAACRASLWTWFSGPDEDSIQREGARTRSSLPPTAPTRWCWPSAGRTRSSNSTRSATFSTGGLDLPDQILAKTRAGALPNLAMMMMGLTSADPWAAWVGKLRLPRQGCELRLLWIETPGAQDDAERQEILGVASARDLRSRMDPERLSGRYSPESSQSYPRPILLGASARP